MDHFHGEFGCSVRSEYPVLDYYMNGPLENDDQHSRLLVLVTDHEVMPALSSIDNNKSPEPDGNGSYFFMIILSPWFIIFLWN